VRCSAHVSVVPARVTVQIVDVDFRDHVVADLRPGSRLVGLLEFAVITFSAVKCSMATPSGLSSSVILRSFIIAAIVASAELTLTSS